MAIKGTLTRITDIYAEPAAFSGKTVRLGGWVKTIRSSNAFGFLELNDGTCFKNLQIVFESDKINNYKEVAKLNVSASVIASGVLELTPGAKQPFELKAAEIEICGASTPDYPIQPKKHSFEFLRTVAHLRPRANTFNAVFRVRSVAAQGIHRFFADKGFVYVNTPIITASDAEGAGEMFRVTTLDINDPPRTEEGKVDYSQDFFGKSTNLTVSGQLEAECFALAYSNVYTFGPTFRAENSN
ncbi:MAG: asparagine--tRNA ligase, partial [Clostridia bacterium]|nr:asparagine--tRNA ligase [Clostridia bacterium]